MPAQITPFVSEWKVVTKTYDVNGEDFPYQTWDRLSGNGQQVTEGFKPHIYGPDFSLSASSYPENTKVKITAEFS